MVRAGDLRCQCTHYDVIVMLKNLCSTFARLKLFRTQKLKNGALVIPAPSSFHHIIAYIKGIHLLSVAAPLCCQWLWLFMCLRVQCDNSAIHDYTCLCALTASMVPYEIMMLNATIGMCLSHGLPGTLYMSIVAHSSFCQEVHNDEISLWQCHMSIMTS